MFAVRQGHADFGDGGEVARAGVAEDPRQPGDQAGHVMLALGAVGAAQQLGTEPVDAALSARNCLDAHLPLPPCVTGGPLLHHWPPSPECAGLSWFRSPRARPITKRPAFLPSPGAALHPDRSRLASRSIVTGRPPDSYYQNAKRFSEFSDAQRTQESRIAGSARRLRVRAIRAEREVDHGPRGLPGQDPRAGGDDLADVGQPDRPELGVARDAADLAGAPAVLGAQVGPWRGEPAALEAQAGEAALHLAQVVDSGDRLLARIATLVQMDMGTEQPGLLGEHVVGQLLAPAGQAPLDPRQFPGLQRRERHARPAERLQPAGRRAPPG